MKKIIFFLFLLLPFLAKPQSFVPAGSPAVTNQWVRLAAKLNFYLPHTHGLTLNGGLDTLGAMIYEDSSSHIWYRDTILSGGHKWVMLLRTGDAGIGTVTSIIFGYGLLGGTITTTGTVTVDTATLSNYYVRRKDSTIVFVTPTQMNAQGYIKNINGIIAGGDLTGTYPNPTLALNVVTFAKFQQLPPFAFVGNPTASTSNAQASYYGYGLLWNNDTVKVDTTTLKHVFGATGIAGITQLIGDGTAGPGSGTQTFTLATVNGNVFGSNTMLKFSVNGKGLVTAAAPVLAADLNGIYGYTPIPLTAISATSPIVYNNATGVISCPTCGVSSGGITTLNGLTNANQTFAIGYAGTSFNISSVTSTHTFNIPLVNGSDTGLVTPALFATWNAKINLTSLSALSPLVYNSGTGQFTIQQANTSQSGYLSSTDWNTFNNKQAAIVSSANQVIYNNGTSLGGSNELLFTHIATQNNFYIGTSASNDTATLVLGGSSAINGLGIVSTADGPLLVNGFGSLQLEVGNATKMQLTSTSVFINSLPSGNATDSVVVWNPSTGKLGVATRIITFGAVQGLAIEGTTGDSIGMNGFFYHPDTLRTLRYAFLITGLPDKATLLATDSVLIETAAGQLYKVPSSALGGGGGSFTFSNGLTLTGSNVTLGGALTGSTTITSNAANQMNWTGTFTTTANNQYFDNYSPTVTLRGTASDVFSDHSYTPSYTIGANNQTVNVLSIVPLVSVGSFTGTTTNALFLQGNIAFGGTTATYTIGSLANIALQVYSRNISSDGSLALSYASGGATLNFAKNGVLQAGLLSTGQWTWPTYIANAFPGSQTADTVVTENAGKVRTLPISAFALVGQTETITGSWGFTTAPTLTTSSTVGYVWTATNTSGLGAWQPAPGGGTGGGIGVDSVQTYTSGATVTQTTGYNELIINPASTVSSLTVTTATTFHSSMDLYIRFGGTNISTGPVVTSFTLTAGSGLSIITSFNPNGATYNAGDLLKLHKVGSILYLSHS